jgi:ubiquinone/menaquinone biosynthesis C-methylase UbiE
MKKIIKGKKLDFTIEDVNEVYEGPVGVLWEILMGEQIHVGGEKQTDILAGKAGISKNTSVLDICSALGGPARHLAGKYGCKVTGLDATMKMVAEATTRTKKEKLAHLVTYKLGNALDIPFKAGSFDIVWGQDAWCYVTDKERLVKEGHRVLKPGGIVAFTDWMQKDSMPDKEWEALNNFMVFPYMESLEGYGQLLNQAGFDIIEKEDLSEDFAAYCHIYQDKIRNGLKDSIISQYGIEMFQVADTGLALWVKAADEGKVGWGRMIGRKV